MLASPGFAQPTSTTLGLKVREIAPPPASLSEFAMVANLNGAVLLIDFDDLGEVEISAMTVPKEAADGPSKWRSALISASSSETTPAIRPGSAIAAAGKTMYLVGGVEATKIEFGADLSIARLPDLPEALDVASAVVAGGKLYVAGQAAGDGANAFYSLELANKKADWQSHSPWSTGSSDRLKLLASGAKLVLLTSDGKAFSWEPGRDWHKLDQGQPWPAKAEAANVGESHLFLFTPGGIGETGVATYHTITDRWFNAKTPAIDWGNTIRAASHGKSAVVVSNAGVFLVEPVDQRPSFSWIDRGVVGLYLLGMIGLGAIFVRRSNSDEYFRGGRRIPWWATGMSLFATGASAISLMSMPGKSFSDDWEFFAVSIFSLLMLPIGLFILVPLVRRLNIKTANEYLERRFGVTARLFAATVFMFMQIATRFAAIMILPALAMEAIFGLDPVVGIGIMGLIATVYTFLGGLSAVIWTDTIQGFVMICAVAGCLVLALTRFDGGVGDGFSTGLAAGKFELFDVSPSLLRMTTLAWLINVVVISFGGISDQNFVQRVQAVETIGDARKAVATQMLVAVPINVLLFALGTALWLFYRDRPEQLNPGMATDTIFPFFVAQHLPWGLSGLVMAALLAATMSTISSAICSVSDLGVNDFYKRFNPGASDESALMLGRTMTFALGMLGTGLAIFLQRLGTPSVWDLALQLTGLITNGILGLFWLGLLTRRAHEVGALIGVACGMATVWVLQTQTDVTFLIYQAAGAIVAIAVGYAMSIAIPMKSKATDGLTLASLRKAAPVQGDL